MTNQAELGIPIEHEPYPSEEDAENKEARPKATVLVVDISEDSFFNVKFDL